MTDKYLVHIWAGIRSIKIAEIFDQLWVETIPAPVLELMFIPADTVTSEAKFIDKPFYYSGYASCLQQQMNVRQYWNQCNNYGRSTVVHCYHKIHEALTTNSSSNIQVNVTIRCWSCRSSGITCMCAIFCLLKPEYSSYKTCHKINVHSLKTE